MGRKKKEPSSRLIGERIRELRQAKGLTQAGLAREVGLSRRMMAYYEIQGGEPRPDLLLRFARVLGVSIEVLTGERPEKKRATDERPDFRLWRRLKRIQELPPHDRKTVLKMIDAMANEASRRKTG
jgi:transcriptional regulator with XRE-family HTH domain